MVEAVRVAFLLFAFIASLALSGRTEAALINPVSQQRTVSASAGSPDGNDSNSDSAPDFGVFDTSVSAHVSGPNGDIDATASQLSVILGDRVTGEGAVTGGSNSPFPGGEGHSSFSLTFDLFQSVDYQINFFLRSFSSIGDSGEAIGFLELSGGPANETILRFDVNGQEPQIESGPVNGVLAAGRYNLQARTDLYPMGFSSDFGTFDFDFAVVPEPSTTVLLGFGLTTLAARRRRRQDT